MKLRDGVPRALVASRTDTPPTPLDLLLVWELPGRLVFRRGEDIADAPARVE